MFIESMILSNGKDGRCRRPVTVAVAMMAHVAVVTLLILVPLLRSGSLPPIPMAQARCQLIDPALPPPPPPPAARASSPRPQHAPPRATLPPPDAPLVAPREVPQNTLDDLEIDLNGPDDGEGVPGGVIGGTKGGVLGNLPTDAAPGGQGTVPIRPGGTIRAPRLIKRVAPKYPPIAIAAGVQGTVILEATTDIEGHVVSVSVLRSIPLLDNAAKEAVRQWIYTPVYLNGQAYPVIFTVQVVFTLNRP